MNRFRSTIFALFSLIAALAPGQSRADFVAEGGRVTFSSSFFERVSGAVRFKANNIGLGGAATGVVTPLIIGNAAPGEEGPDPTIYLQRLINDASIPATATFTGSVSGTVLTVTSVSSGTIALNDILRGTSVNVGTLISSFGTGVGGTGTYNLSTSDTIGSQSFTTAPITTGHGITDDSLFNRSGETAYASFDAKTSYLGVDYDHFVGFQARPYFNITGTINSVRLHDSRPASSATANALNIFHYYASGDDEWDGTVSGTQYGLFVAEMTKGLTRWGVNVANNDNKFGQLITKKEGNIQGVNGSIGKSAFYMSNNSILGIFRPSSTAMAVQYEAVEKLRVDATGVRVQDISGLDAQIEIRGYRSQTWSANVSTAASWTETNGGEITITTTTSHGVAVGQQFLLSGFTPSGYNGTYGAATGTTGSTLVAAKDLDPGVSTVQGQLDAKADASGNSIITFSGPDSSSTAGQTITDRGFIVLPASTADSHLIIGGTAAGNASLGSTASTIKGASDIAIAFDSDGFIDFYRQSSTAFARISGVGASFITIDTNGTHEFFVRNVNAGVSASAFVAAYNGTNATDRIAMAATGTGSTLSGAYFTADSGTLYTGSTLSGGLRLAATNSSASIFFYAGGTSQLAATMTPNTRPSLVVGNAALATTATDGFIYMAGGAGPPTGVPTAFTGRYPFYWDTTNKQLYVYDAAWLQPKTPAAAAIVNWQ